MSEVQGGKPPSSGGGGVTAGERIADEFFDGTCQLAREELGERVDTAIAAALEDERGSGPPDITPREAALLESATRIAAALAGVPGQFLIPQELFGKSTAVTSAVTACSLLAAIQCVERERAEKATT